MGPAVIAPRNVVDAVSGTHRLIEQRDNEGAVEMLVAGIGPQHSQLLESAAQRLARRLVLSGSG